MDMTEQGISNLRGHFDEKDDLECQVSNRSFYAFRRPYHLEKKQNTKKLALENSNNFIVQECGLKGCI